MNRWLTALVLAGTWLTSSPACRANTNIYALDSQSGGPVYSVIVHSSGTDRRSMAGQVVCADAPTEQSNIDVTILDAANNPIYQGSIPNNRTLLLYAENGKWQLTEAGFYKSFDERPLDQVTIFNATGAPLRFDIEADEPTYNLKNVSVGQHQMTARLKLHNSGTCLVKDAKGKPTGKSFDVYGGQCWVVSKSGDNYQAQGYGPLIPGSTLPP